MKPLTNLATKSILVVTALSSSFAWAAPSILCKVKFVGEEAIHSDAPLNADGCVLVTVDSRLDSNKKFWGGACGNIVALSFTSGSEATSLARGENRVIFEIPGQGAGTCEIASK